VTAATYRGGNASVVTIKLQNLAKSRRDTPRARNAAGIEFDFTGSLPETQT